MGRTIFELRSDLLSLQQIHWLKELIPDSMILLSIRGNKEIPFSTIYTDWALELGAPSEKANIVSLHERKDSFTKTVETFKDYKGLHWKLAVEVKNWQELQEGYEWWQEDTQNRSFLPRSTNGRWSWFRLLHKYNMKLNFFREDIGSSLDQPYLVDWCNFNEFDQNQFGAVLGDPILHSWTPEEQRRFWSKDQCNSLKISLSEEDWTPQNLGFLKRLGMKYAAVTTPLKSKAYEICDVQDELSNELQSVNTLLFNNNEILGMNTDFEGLKTVCESQLLPRLNKPLEQWKVGVWGGGGTLAMIKKLFPQVVHFSARTGKTDVEKTFFEKLKRSNKYHFDVFIWAVGRERIDQGAVMPSQDLSFEYILDLNYAENSPGKELALMQGTQYISGEAMFLAQADLQRKFWSSSLT